jgi:hypothetical protein
MRKFEGGKLLNWWNKDLVEQRFDNVILFLSFQKLPLKIQRSILFHKITVVCFKHQRCQPVWDLNGEKACSDQRGRPGFLIFLDLLHSAKYNLPQAPCITSLACLFVVKPFLKNCSCGIFFVTFRNTMHPFYLFFSLPW